MTVGECLVFLSLRSFHRASDLVICAQCCYPWSSRRGERERERERKDGERRERKGKRNEFVFVLEYPHLVCMSAGVCFSTLDHWMHSASISSGQRSLQIPSTLWNNCFSSVQFSSVQFSCSVVSDSL